MLVSYPRDDLTRRLEISDRNGDRMFLYEDSLVQSIPREAIVATFVL